MNTMNIALIVLLAVAVLVIYIIGRIMIKYRNERDALDTRVGELVQYITALKEHDKKINEIENERKQIENKLKECTDEDAKSIIDSIINANNSRV